MSIKHKTYVVQRKQHLQFSAIHCIQQIVFESQFIFYSTLIFFTLCTTVLPTAVAGKSYMAENEEDGVGVDKIDATGDADSILSSTSLEILQLPHNFRHQEHHSHRIEQAVNDFRRAQLQQQKKTKERDGNLTGTLSIEATRSVSSPSPSTASAFVDSLEIADTLPVAGKITLHEKSNNNGSNIFNYKNKQTRNRQQQEAQQQRQEHSTASSNLLHHRRHEQHLQHRQQRLEQIEQQLQQEGKQQHYLRHHNQHHAQQQQHRTTFSGLRHQRHYQHYEQQHFPAFSTLMPAPITAAPPPIVTTKEPSSIVSTSGISMTTEPGNEHFNVRNSGVDVYDDEHYVDIDDVQDDNVFLMVPSTNSSLNFKSSPQQRFFDRQSVYNNPLTWIQPTRGPKTSSSAPELIVNEQVQNIVSNNKNGNNYDNGKDSEKLGRVYNDEGMPALPNSYSKGSNILNRKRFSLKFKEPTTANENWSRRKSIIRPHNEYLDDVEGNNENDYIDDMLTDDNSFETLHNVNEYSASKAAVKRLTHAYKQKMLRPGASTTTRNYNGFNAQRRLDINASIANYDEGEGDNDDDDHDHDNPDGIVNEMIDFSMEQWQKIQHEHHVKQQQHQRDIWEKAMQVRYDSKMNGISHNLKSPYNNHNKQIYNQMTTAGGGVANSNMAAKRQASNKGDDEYFNSPNYIPGTLSHKKQNELSNNEAVKESMRSFKLRSRQHTALAKAHTDQIHREASCRFPQRRIERIQKDASKVYTPHCTVLHRCGDDTGCCKSDRQTCAPLSTETVELYFFVKSIKDTKGTIERLTFINHTECHCIERSKERAAEFGNSQYNNESHFDISKGMELSRATILNCNCPKLYEKILQENGYCRCDCSSGNMGCDLMKRGKEHFSMEDRKCISEGRCKPPTCEHGPYLKKHGRCPRREEQQLPLISNGGNIQNSPTASGSNNLKILTTNSLSLQQQQQYNSHYR